MKTKKEGAADVSNVFEKKSIISVEEEEEKQVYHDRKSEEIKQPFYPLLVLTNRHSKD